MKAKASGPTEISRGAQIASSTEKNMGADDSGAKTRVK